MKAPRPKGNFDRVLDAALAFWDGFTAPTRLSLGLMVASLLATVLVAGLMVTPERLAGSLGDYLPRSTKDTEAFATREALILASPAAAADTRPHLYLIGNSLMAHALASEPGMTRVMKDRTGTDWSVHFLTTPLQGPIDEAAFADVATKQRPGVVVLALGFERFGAAASEYLQYYDMARLGFRSDWADDQVRMLGGKPTKRTGIYAVDNRNFLIRNAATMALRVVTGRAPERRIDAYLLGPRLTDKELVDRRIEIIKILRKGVEPDKLALDLLAETTKRLKARGNRVVYLELPVSPALLTAPADRALYDSYLAKAPAIAAKLGGEFCRPGPEAHPGPAAFPDFFHVDDRKAQALLREELAACIARGSQGHAS